MNSTNAFSILAILALSGMAMGQESILQPEAPEVTAEPPAKAPPAAPAPAKPASNPEAVAILNACSQAIVQARAITYNALHRVEGSLAASLGSQSGQVTLIRDDSNVFAIRLTGVDSKKVETAFDVAYHGSTVEWIDNEERKVFERPSNDPQSRNKLIQASKFLRDDEFLKPVPFQNLDDAVLTLAGTETIDGLPCTIVEIERSAKKIKWFIAAADHFPRRIVIAMPGSYGEMILNLTGVTIDNQNPPAISPQLARVPVPADFVEDRRAAPPPPPAHNPVVQPPASSTNIEKQNDQPAAIAPVPARPEPELPKVAPDFELTVGRGPNGEPAEGKVKLADLAGSVAVLDFFGSWTLAAPAWHAELDTLHADFASQGVKFYCLNVREKNPDAAIAMMNDARNTPALLMSADEVARAFGVRAFPATVVIDKDAKIIEFIQGAREGGESKAKIKDAIERALGQTPTTPLATTETKDAEAPKPADSEPAKPDAEPAPK